MLLKLRKPIAWGGDEEELVNTVILFAMRESDGSNNHLRVLATLARKLMHEEFREGLNRPQAEAELCALLSETIQPQPAPAKDIER
jgi:mannitol/fructose-specific phosphotransferase system IIA component (Ntr-type)